MAFQYYINLSKRRWKGIKKGDGEGMGAGVGERKANLRKEVLPGGQ